VTKPDAPRCVGLEKKEVSGSHLTGRQGLRPKPEKDFKKKRERGTNLWNGGKIGDERLKDRTLAEAGRLGEKLLSFRETTLLGR